MNTETKPAEVVGSSGEVGRPTQAACQHRRYTVDTREQTGRCIDCGAEGRMRFVVGDPVAEEREACAKTCEEVATWAGTTWRNAGLDCAAWIRKRLNAEFSGARAAD